MKTRILSLGVALLLAGCGGGVEGTYTGGDDSFLQSMTFKGDGKVDVVLINGIGGEGTYEIDGDKVRVSANGTTNELTIDGDCLRGPLGVGTLCTGGAQPGTGASAASTSRGGGLAGSTFELTGGGGRMAFEFTDGRSVRVSTVAPGAAEGSGWIDGTYTMSGDQVTIVMQGEPATFTLSGDTLNGNLDGDVLTLRRR